MPRMLDLLNVDGQVRLACEVVRYQFPALRTDNWCVVRLEVSQGKRSYVKEDPALETQDLVRLREWFQCLAEDRLPRYAHLTFVEPCLSFEFLGKDDAGVRFSVHLSAELRPDFRLKQLSLSTRSWQVVFHLGAEALGAIVERIEASVRRFPVRHARDH